MSYEAWRISYQSSEQAARAAFDAAERYRNTLAWEIYCRETAGDAHVADFWGELPDYVQQLYVVKAATRSESTQD